MKKIEATGINIYTELKKLGAVNVGAGWGTVINNPCEKYRLSNGSKVEVYGVEVFGIPTSAFILERK